MYDTKDLTLEVFRALPEEVQVALVNDAKHVLDLAYRVKLAEVAAAANAAGMFPGEAATQYANAGDGFTPMEILSVRWPDDEDYGEAEARRILSADLAPLLRRV